MVISDLRFRHWSLEASGLYQKLIVCEMFCNVGSSGTRSLNALRICSVPTGKTTSFLYICDIDILDKRSFSKSRKFTVARVTRFIGDLKKRIGQNLSEKRVKNFRQILRYIFFQMPRKSLLFREQLRRNNTS